MFDDLFGQLLPYFERRASADRVHLRISKLPGGTWALSCAFSDPEEVIYPEGPSLSPLVEEAIGEPEERGF
jgi:hypothetical protein